MKQFVNLFMQDVHFTIRYNSTPNVFVSANHSSGGKNLKPMHNGITAWVEVRLRKTGICYIF